MPRLLALEVSKINSNLVLRKRRSLIDLLFYYSRITLITPPSPTAIMLEGLSDNGAL